MLANMGMCSSSVFFYSFQVCLVRYMCVPRYTYQFTSPLPTWRSESEEQLVVHLQDFIWRLKHYCTIDSSTKKSKPDNAATLFVPPIHSMQLAKNTSKATHPNDGLPCPTLKDSLSVPFTSSLCTSSSSSTPPPLLGARFFASSGTAR